MPIINHALQSERHTPVYDQLYEGRCRFDGVDVDFDACMDSGNFAKAEEVDESKVPAGLMLVKDDGIYLMSNGSERLPNPNGGEESSLVAYAQGYDSSKAADVDKRGFSDDVWQASREAVGGDDFSFFVDTHLLTDAIESRKPLFVIKASPERFVFSMEGTPLVEA